MKLQFFQSCNLKMLLETLAIDQKYVFIVMAEVRTKKTAVISLVETLASAA